MNFPLRRPSPALVIACIALFVSMGGVSYAFATGSIDSREIKDGTVNTKDLRNNEVRGVDIRNSTIGGRDVAFNSLTGNDIKESTLAKVPAATRSDVAGTAANAGSLGGVPASGYAKSEPPAFTPLTLEAGWTVPGGEVAPGYDVDAGGYVHLRGTALRAGGGTVATLPAGARPAGTSRFAIREGTGTGVLTIEASGQVVSSATTTEAISLDGVTFAAAAP